MREDKKFEPRSDRISLGIDSLVMMDIIAMAMSLAVNIRRETTSGYLEPRLIYVSTNLFFFLVIGRGPTISMVPLSNDEEIDGAIGVSGALECVFLAVF